MRVSIQTRILGIRYVKVRLMSNSNCNFRASGFKFEADRKYEKKSRIFFSGFEIRKLFFRPLLKSKVLCRSRRRLPKHLTHHGCHDYWSADAKVWQLAFVEVVVVAQVVEQWHSVWTGQAWIRGLTYPFFSKELLSINSH